MSYFIIQKISFASRLKSSRVKLREGFSLSKEKLNNKVLSFGSKSYKFRTHGKYSRNNKVKYFVNVCIRDKFDMLFWCS